MLPSTQERSCVSAGMASAGGGGAAALEIGDRLLDPAELRALAFAQQLAAAGTVGGALPRDLLALRLVVGSVRAEASSSPSSASQLTGSSDSTRPSRSVNQFRA
jgi:hypothetical protein